LVPERVIPVVASLALALLLGFHTRKSAQLSEWLLLVFAIGMTAGTGIKSALNASVFSASISVNWAQSPETRNYS
jgi:hypothetical protein